MKVFFILVLFSFMLATCQGACSFDPVKIEFRDGKAMQPSTCLDPHDRIHHLIGSKWNTTQCLECDCLKGGMSCCHRYGGISVFEGCTTVLNPITCEHEHYQLDDPSLRCRV